MSKPLKLYLVEASSDILCEKYDTYNSFVVCCANEKEARETLPKNNLREEEHSGSGYIENERFGYDEEKKYWVRDDGVILGVSGERGYNEWILGKDIDKLKVVLLGTAIKGSKNGIVHASFHHG